MNSSEGTREELLSKVLKRSLAAIQLGPDEEICHFLGDASPSDLESWLKSPFYSAMAKLVQFQIDLNAEDIVRGDIEARSKAESGLLYRTTDQLRGGLIALVNLLEQMPGALKTELEICRDEKRERQEREDGRQE